MYKKTSLYFLGIALSPDRYRHSPVVASLIYVYKSEKNNQYVWTDSPGHLGTSWLQGVSESLDDIKTDYKASFFKYHSYSVTDIIWISNNELIGMGHDQLTASISDWLSISGDELRPRKSLTEYLKYASDQFIAAYAYRYSVVDPKHSTNDFAQEVLRIFKDRDLDFRHFWKIETFYPYEKESYPMGILLSPPWGHKTRIFGGMKRDALSKKIVEVAVETEKDPTPENFNMLWDLLETDPA